MSDPFDWQTDEDGWEAPIVPQVETAVFRKPRWPIILVIIIAVGALWGVVQWQVRESVQAATVNVEADLIAAHTFFRQTAVHNDQDLLKPLLSSRDLRWTKAQEALIDAGIVMNRPMFAWQLQHDPAPLTTDAITISLNNQFDEAVLQIEHEYAVQTPAGITETVTLVQTAVYRKGQTRWLYSPPLDPFWGDWQTHEGQHLTLVYPERDTEWGNRLAFDVDALITEVCQLDGLSCPDDLHLHLRLDKSPQSLLALTNPNYALTNTLRLELPTPTLVGTPVDEAGYTVLYRAYGEQVATAVILNLVGYDCCRWSRVQKGLLNIQLARLGLTHGEMRAETYEALFATDDWRSMATLFSNVQAGTIDTEERLTAYARALAHFLTEAAAPHQTIADMQQSFSEYNAPQKWIDANVTAPYQGEQFMYHFWQFMYDHSTSGQLTDLPIPLPADTLEMICTNPDNISSEVLIAYDWQTAGWQQSYGHEWESGDFGHITPLWNGSNMIPNAYAALSFRISEDGVQTGTKATIIQDGVEQVSIVTESPHAVSNSIDPTMRYLAMYDYATNGELESAGLMDLESCTGGECESWSILNWPRWSPEGHSMLMTSMLPRNETPDFSQSIVYLADARGQSVEPVGSGIAPFWIDNTWFGYVQTNEDAGDMALALVNRTTDEQIVPVTTADLLAAIPASEQTQNLFWQYRIYPQAAQQGMNRLIVEVNDEPDFNGRSYLFLLQWPAAAPENSHVALIYQTDSRNTHFHSLHGDWLTLTKWGNFENYTFILVNLADGRSQQLESNFWNGMSWSSDGNWLVYGRLNRLILYAPEYNIRKFIFHPYDDCNDVFWRQK